jgi:beta-N-acetylhexosaminidase
MLRMVCAVLITALLFSPAAAKQKYQQVAPVKLDRDGEKWAEKTLKKMSLEEKVGQLFMVWARAEFLGADNPQWTQWRDAIRNYHVGGFALSVPVEDGLLQKSEPLEAAAITNQLQRESKVPLIFAADFEHGVAMRLKGAASFPHAMAFGATGRTGDAATLARVTAQEARAIGVQWNFFPDADVNSNPANPIINTRSFGEDPAEVSNMVAAYIQASHAAGMLTTAKHFPGHGDTASDTHLGVAEVTGNRDRLEHVELTPFRRAIAAGVDAVMVAHVTVPALEPNSERVATTSREVVTGLLKQQLGFAGVVITDALDMGALTRHYSNDIGRAAVDALKAGNDVLLIPADLGASYAGVLAAARNGEVPQAQIDASVLKLLKIKASVGLGKARLVDPENVARFVGLQANIAAGQEISDRSITLVRDNGQVLPLKSRGTGAAALPYQSSVEIKNRTVLLIISEDVRSESGRGFAHEIRARIPDANVIYIDPNTASGMASQVMAAANEAEVVISAVYVVPAPGRLMTPPGATTAGVLLPDATGSLLGELLGRQAAKTVVVAMGNPYLAAGFPAVQNYLCAFSNVTVSERSAVKALFAEVPIRGHLPVTIPGIAQRGAGLDHWTRLQNGVGYENAHH